tara:strand:- start:13313 stop:14608 length:1296 start_codon:yes stop_codon:yes gene_type:complete
MIVLYSLLSLLFLLFSGLHVCLLFKKSELNHLSLCLGAMALSGLLLTYLLWLILQDFTSVFWSILIINFLSLLFIFRKMKLLDYRLQPQSYIYIAMSILFLLLCVAMPILDWDARSIWFFHAKALYFSEGNIFISGLDNLAYIPAHPHYPKLYSSVAGFYSYLFQTWNDYFPKIASALFLMPVLLILHSFRDRKFFWLLVIGLLGMSGKYLWNGYLDGFIAIYLSLALLIYYQKLDAKLNIVIISLLMAICMNLKTEGFVLVAIGVFSVLLLDFKRGLKVLKSKMAWLFILSALLCSFLWRLIKQKMQLRGYFNATDMLSDMMRRFSEPSEISYILTSLLKENAYYYILAICFFVILKKYKKEIQAWYLPFSATVYFMILFFIYMSSPYNLSMHLDHSVVRVSFVIKSLLFLWVYIHFTKNTDLFFLKRKD